MESNCIWKRARAHAPDFFFDRLIDDSIKYFSDLMGCNETSWWFNVIETSFWWFSLLLWFLGSKTIERDVVMWWSNLLNLTIIRNHVKASRSLDKTRLAVCKCVVISTIMHAFLSNTEIFRWFISAIRCLVWKLERSKGAHTCTPLLSSLSLSQLLQFRIVRVLHDCQFHISIFRTSEWNRKTHHQPDIYAK